MTARAGRAARVLVVADAPALREALRTALEADGRFACGESESAAAAIAAAYAGQLDVCIVSLRDDSLLVATVAAITAQSQRTKVVVHAPAIDEQTLLATLRAGAVGYLPAEPAPSDVRELLTRALAGQAFLPGDALARLLAELRSETQRSARRAARDGQLSAREWEVLELLADDLSTGEIAARLRIKEATVRSHIAATVRKLQVTSRHAAIRVYRRSARPFGSPS